MRCANLLIMLDQKDNWTPVGGDELLPDRHPLENSRSNLLKYKQFPLIAFRRVATLLESGFLLPMKYALVNGVKTEASKGPTGICPSCGSELIAKCGNTKIHHWSHKGIRNCDKWWENETEWHRKWKGHFPVEWQEIVHFDDQGEKHIADVKTPSGWAIEFQHSFLKPEERSSRDEFYQQLVWVVDGTRRKTDRKQFDELIRGSTKLPSDIPIYQTHPLDECRLIAEWGNSSLVFFDFQQAGEDTNSHLWFLFPKTTSFKAYLSPFSRDYFIELFTNDNFDGFLSKIIHPYHSVISEMEARQKASTAHRAASLRHQPPRYASRRRRRL